MCGFLVEYNYKKQLSSKTDFLKNLSLSKNRGPDSRGYWSDNSTIQMGFNRLAIIELSASGEQPMSSYNSRYTIVFNGEIYNHCELRKQLKFNKYRGNSDTETLTACLEEWGIKKTITSLNGMFSIVIYDHLETTLSLVRDFAGIKPLFYGYKDGFLIAASQYDQIAKHHIFSNGSINNQVLKLYLQQHFLPAPFGLLENTHQVLPGECITFKKDGTKEHWRYWELPNNITEDLIEDENQAIALIDSVLQNAVKRQTISDVPLGAFLSGGVDSALICSNLKHDSLTKVFTIGSDSEIHDESVRAKKYAEVLNLDSHLWHLNSKIILNHWTEIVGALHEPIGDFSIIPTFLVSKLARKNVTVALSGDGGDELFLGYERFWSVGKNIRYQNYPDTLRKGIYGFDKYVTGNQKVNRVLLEKKQSKAHQGLHSRFRAEWLNNLAPDLTTVNLPSQYNVYDYDNAKNDTDLMFKMRHAEFYGMMQKTLRKVDLASMHSSLEVRVPFLDKEVIEASLKISPKLNYGNSKRKQVLKHLLAYKMPTISKEKNKKGFTVPLGKWIREDLKTTFTETLLNSDVEKYGFKKSVIEKMLSQHATKQDLKWPLFTLFTLIKHNETTN